jgi:hypothetical protein
MAKKNKYKNPDKGSTKYKEPPEKDNNLEKPIFSFEHMPYKRRYCLTKCDKDDRADIIEHIVEVSQLMWQDIESAGRKGHGYEKISLGQFHATKFPGIVTKDVQKLDVFTYSHGGRMAGLKVGRVFNVIFVGDDLYDH